MTGTPAPELDRAQSASHVARIILPGPVGELVHNELQAWSKWAWRFDKTGFGMKLIKDVEKRHREWVAERTYG